MEVTLVGRIYLWSTSIPPLWWKYLGGDESASRMDVKISFGLNLLPNGWKYLSIGWTDLHLDEVPSNGKMVTPVECIRVHEEGKKLSIHFEEVKLQVQIFCYNFKYINVLKHILPDQMYKRRIELWIQKLCMQADCYINCLNGMQQGCHIGRLEAF
jgi:hypothetical protein